MLSDVQEFYKGKTVLVTGGTGFMGKVLVEKLLYSCSEMKALYLLLRPKRGQEPYERLKTMCELPMFQRIRDEKPDVLRKLIPLQGDITSENLGLDEISYNRVIHNTNIVFHCAATVRLDAKLKDAVQMNITGTHRMLKLAKQMQNLQMFLHLSTAFCYCDLEELHEKVTDSPHNPHDIMRMVEWMDDKTLDTVTPELLKPHPNTYTYAKRLAEMLVYEERNNIPCAIARPSIVTPSVKEPLPGWVDNLNGPIGLMVSGGKGVCRSMLCNADYIAQVLPVDYAINGMITIAYSVATKMDAHDDIPVYNLNSDESKLTTWGSVFTRGRKYLQEIPYELSIWYPSGEITTCKYLHMMRVLLFQWLPAYLVDFLLLCFGQPRFMVRIQHRVQLGLNILQYFTTREWYFKSTNFSSLKFKLTPQDQEIFNMDPTNVDEDEYVKQCVLGGRQYCMKEPLSTLPRARRNLKILYVLHKSMMVFWILLFTWLILKITGIYSYFETSTRMVRTY